MSCLHDDCFTCPYPDCVSAKGPYKSKAIPVDLERQRKSKSEYDKKYYQAHREKKLADSKRRYEERKKAKEQWKNH